jgi:hypothetical protein
MYPDSSTSTMDEMSSALRPQRCRSARPASDCSAQNRTLPAGSQSSTKLTPPLHMLHTPSKRITGRRSRSVKYSRGDDVDGDVEARTRLAWRERVAGSVRVGQRRMHAGARESTAISGTTIFGQAVPPPRAALHPAAVSCAPCDTVHTHPAKHHATARSEQCAPLTRSHLLVRVPRPWHCLSPQRCNVNDARYIRRCWCSSDAVNTRRYVDRHAERAIRVTIFAGAAWGGTHSPADAREVM